jgi:hypothetical protein
MMKRGITGKAFLVAALALTAATARADEDDTGKKVRHGAQQVGQTVEHGARGVGRGGAKLYHDTARGIHRIIAKNAHSERTAEEHQADADRHRRHAAANARRSEKELNRAGKAAGRVTD